MSVRLVRLRPADPLETALVAAADLDRTQLEQLRAHVTALLPPFPAVPVAVLRRHPPPPEGAPSGPRGGGYVEWKHIRHGTKVYGPYPYWRVHLGGRQRSFYLRGLAQAAGAGTTVTE
jgi:hypothetical protein